jgi:hypothetical protein
MGSETIYPLEYNEIVVPILEGVFMNCDEIAECLLANENFLSNLINYLINNETFLGGIGNYVARDLIVDTNNQLSDSSDVIKGLKSSTNDKDAVWGACFELTEYMLDLLKTLCFFLSAVEGVTDLVSQLYDADKKKRYKFEGQDQDNNGVTIGNDGEIVNNGGDWEFIPNILGQLVQTISESTMVAFLANLAGIGADLILADINDTRTESIACVIFNTITCLDEQPIPPPYIFDNDVFFDSGQAMLGNLNVGLAGNAIALCMTVAGTVNSFVSIFPLNEVHRNYAIGLKSPSSEWEVICDTCLPDPCEAVEIEPVNFGTTPNGVSITTEFPIGSSPELWIWQPLQIQEFSFGTNNFGQVTIEYQPEIECNRNVQLTYSRRNTNTCTAYIDTFTTTDGWVERAVNSISVGTVSAFIQTLTWNNNGLVTYEKIRFRIVSPFPNLNKFNIL